MTDEELTAFLSKKKPTSSLKLLGQKEPDIAADVVAKGVEALPESVKEKVVELGKTSTAQAGKKVLGPVMTGLGKVLDVGRRATLAPITGAISYMQNREPFNLVDYYKAMGKNVVADEPKYWGEVVRGAGVDTEKTPGRLLAGTLNFAADPLWAVKPLSLTEKGLAAQKALGAGEKLGSYAEQAAKGQRTLLGWGIGESASAKLPEVISKPALTGMSKIADLVRNVPSEPYQAARRLLRKGFSTGSTSPEANKIIELLKQKKAYSATKAEDYTKGLEEGFKDVAAKYKMPVEKVKIRALQHANIPVKFEMHNPERELIPKLKTKYVSDNLDALKKKFKNLNKPEAVEHIDNMVKALPEVQEATKKFNDLSFQARKNFEIGSKLKPEELELSKRLEELSHQASEIDYSTGKKYKRISGYQYQLLTPEAKEFIEKNGKNITGKNPKKLSDYFASEHTRTIRRKTIPEANREAEAGLLDELPGFKGKVFEDDPTHLATSRLRRSLESDKSMEIMSNAMKEHGITDKKFTSLNDDLKRVNSLKIQLAKKKIGIEDYENQINEVYGKYKNPKELDDFSKIDYQKVESALLPGKDRKNGKVTAYFPKHIAEALETEGAKKVSKELSTVEKAYDKINRSYKKWWLSYPGNVVRDLGPGNTMQAWMAGVSPLKLTKEWKKLYNPIKNRTKNIEFKLSYGSTVKGDSAWDELLRQRVVGGTQMTAETKKPLLASVPKTKAGKILGKASELASKIGLAKVARIPGKYAEKFSQFRVPLEDAQRAAMYKVLREKGYSENAAGQVVRKHLFDYGDITEFEKRVLQRGAPYYTWSRKNVPLALENIVKQPAKSTVAARINASREDKGPDEEHMSPWMKAAEGLRLNDGKYLSTASVVPSADITGLTGKGRSVKDIIKGSGPATARFVRGMVAPWLTVPFDLAANKDPFMGRNIRNVPGEKARMLGAEVDPRIKYAVTKLAGPVAKAGIAVDRSNLTTGEKLMRLGLGANIFKYDEAKGKRQEAGALINRINDIRSYLKYQSKLANDETLPKRDRDTAAGNVKAARAEFIRLRDDPKLAQYWNE